MDKPSKKKDRILGLISVIVAAFFIYVASGLPKSEYAGDPGMALMPYIGSGIMAIFGIFVGIRPTADAKDELEGKQWIDALKMFLLYLLTAFLFWFFGFNVAVPVLIFIAAFMMSKLSATDQTFKKRLIIAVIFAAVASVVLYLAYVVGLRATLPRGVFWKLIG